MISINGTRLPKPTKYQVGLSDLDSSDTTRTESGKLVRNRVRQGVTKIELSFILKGSEVAPVLQLIEPAKFEVTYFDPRVFVNKSINAYVGDRSCNMLKYDPTKSREDILWEVSFNLIEY